MMRVKIGGGRGADTYAVSARPRSTLLAYATSYRDAVKRTQSTRVVLASRELRLQTAGSHVGDSPRFGVPTLGEGSLAVDPVSIGVKLGVEVLTKAAPSGFRWIATKLFGVSMLAIGERRAGKSSFVNYFEYGLLLPPGTSTPRTEEIRDTAAFELSIGRDKSLRMKVRRVTDTRGHSTIKEQCDLIARRRPDVLMIFLDASRNWDVPDDDYGSRYLSLLLDELSVRAARAPGIAKKLRHFCIVLNKVETLTKQDYAKKEKAVRSILRQPRAASWGPSHSEIAIYQCIAIEHERAVPMLDGIIKSAMAAVLLKGQR